MANFNYCDSHEGSKRVYINPNFQRNGPVTQNTPMHINPLFAQHNNASLNSGSKSKIYINPNFVKPVTPAEHNRYTTSTHTNSRTNYTVNRPAETNYQYLSSIPSTSTTTIVHKPEFKHPTPSNAVAKSRYSLVRQKNHVINEVSQPATQTLPKVVTTYKINKYKSVSVESMKNKSVTPISKAITNSQIIEITKRNMSPRLFQSRFKLIKKSTTITPLKVDMKATNIRLIKSPTLRRRLSLNTAKIKLKSNQKAKIKIDKAKFKKNNIPCPNFRKYGKCLRKNQGHCEFLHDKKHVAICRKFLKGICHDNDCLLSHELTAEKMPTCAFYLKGMCTKEDCRYLHVKLNEKAKICTDFLKGYCADGETCLKRHTNICPDFATKGVCHRKSCPYPHIKNRKARIVKNKFTTKINVSFKSSKKGEEQQKDNNLENKIIEPYQESKKEMDQRYYKSINSVNQETETIKPSRCKLGALPSYIQL